MTSKNLTDLIGMVDPALVERASKPHTVKHSVNKMWIATVAAVLALAISVGVWGGVNLFNRDPGKEDPPAFAPLGSGSSTTPDESTPEVTPDESTPKVTPDESTPEATPDESTPEVTPDETTPDVTLDETTPETTPQGTNPQTPAYTDPIDPPGTLPENIGELLPPKIDLGEEMDIIAGVLYQDEWLKETDGSVDNFAIYERVKRVENKLGITLNVTTVNGKDRTVFADEIVKRQESTDPNMIVDAVSGYSFYIGAMTLEGRFQNIAASEKLDLSKPWWPKDTVNSAIDGKIYFVTGDISPTTVYETFAIYYNADYVSYINNTDPMVLVNEYKWTLDMLITLTSGIYNDADKSGTVNDGDLLAFNFNDRAHYKALPFAAGIRVISPDVDEGYVIDDSYFSENMEIISGKLTQWIKENPGVNCPDSGYSDYRTGFSEGDIIFNLGSIANGGDIFKNSGVRYYFVPCPMFDENQGEYYSYYGNPSSFWAVPSNAASIDNSATLLEYLAADAYLYISPAIFEETAYNKDNVLQERMFNILRQGLIVDPCMPYGNYIGGYKQFSDAFDLNSSGWQMYYNSFDRKAIKKEVENIVKTLRALEY